MSKKISQREARRVIKELARLRERDEGRMQRWGNVYPNGTNILSCVFDNAQSATLRTAQLLGHVVVLKIDGTTGKFFAMLP